MRPAPQPLPADVLPGQTEFWACWGFEPWSCQGLAGVKRRQHFVKDSFLGHIAEYFCWDYIIWAPGTPAEREAFWQTRQPMSGVMTQRYVFLLDQAPAKRRSRSFSFGFRGFVEFSTYWPEPWEHPDDPVASTVEPTDLTSLVRLGMRQGARDQPLAKASPRART